MPKRSRWIQKAIKREGRVRRYILRIYGKKALDSKGRIKLKYLEKAIRRVKKRGNTSLLKALQLAKTLRKLRRRKRRKR